MKRPIGAHVNTQMSEDIQLAAAVAEVGMILNHSELKGTSNYESVIQLLQPFDNTMSEYSRAEFLTMVEEMPKLITFSEEQKNTILSMREALEKEKYQIAAIEKDYDDKSINLPENLNMKFRPSVIGEYIGRIYLSLNQNPQYVIKEKIGLD